MPADIAYLRDSQPQLDELHRLFAVQRQAYAANPMPPAAQRQQWLKALREVLSDERQALRVRDSIWTRSMLRMPASTKPL